MTSFNDVTGKLFQLIWTPNDHKILIFFPTKSLKSLRSAWIDELADCNEPAIDSEKWRQSEILLASRSIGHSQNYWYSLNIWWSLVEQISWLDKPVGTYHEAILRFIVRNQLVSKMSPCIFPQF